MACVHPMSPLLAPVYRALDRSPGIFAGTFLSGIFALLGIVGIFAFGGRVLQWQEASRWPSVQGTIVSGELVWSTGRYGNRVVRPRFRYEYAWQGISYTAEGYDLLKVYTSNWRGVEFILDSHPPGSVVSLLVNPSAPAQAVLTRGAFTLLYLYLIPPFFLFLGVVGGTFTFAAWRGWFHPASRNPFGRATRAVGRVLLRENVARTLFITVWLMICGVLLAVGIWSRNPIIVALPPFMIWALWRAARPPRER